MGILSSPPHPRHLERSEDVEFFKALTLKGHYALDNDEATWRDRTEFLETHGYVLRSRFRKGWKPSWLEMNLHPDDCEDSLRLISTRLIDATRTSDGQRVVLKRVRRDTTEIRLAQLLHAEGRSEDPDNHCVPILEYLDDIEDRTLGFLVMPLLRSFDEPPFAYISEVLDFVHQTLTGLRFLHRNRIAHRDLAGFNIMMDGDPLYPEGFHPSHQFLHPSVTAYAKAPYVNRRDVSSVKYYIIDFGNSSAFDHTGKVIKRFEGFSLSPEIPADRGPFKDAENDVSDAEALEEAKAYLRRLDPDIDLEGIELYPPPSKSEALPPFMVTGRDALDREVPELSNSVPYNPFYVDIFTLGNVYKKNFLQKYSNLEFLIPLVESMTQTDPKMRPTIDEAIQHFEEIRSNMTSFHICLPLRSLEKPVSRYYMAFADTSAVLRECWFFTWSGIKIMFFPSWLRAGGYSIFTFFATNVFRFRRSGPPSN